MRNAILAVASLRLCFHLELEGRREGPNGKNLGPEEKQQPVASLGVLLLGRLGKAAYRTTVMSQEVKAGPDPLHAQEEAQAQWDDAFLKGHKWIGPGRKSRPDPFTLRQSPVPDPEPPTAPLLS